MRTSLCTVVVVLTVVIPSIAWSNYLISLKLIATGCEHNCFEYADNTTCSSSIIVNGKDLSSKKDGFNVVVIDNFSGKITTAHFRWSSAAPSSVSERTEFHSFFREIKSSSIIIIVFQNMCEYLDKNWYKFLLQQHDTKINVHVNKEPYFIATLVGCKKSCPRAIEGSIPYSYSGSQTKNRHTTSISFKLGTASSSFHGDDSGRNGKGKALSIVVVAAPVGGVVVGAMAFLLCVYVYKKMYVRPRCNEKISYIEGNNIPERTSCNDPLYEEVEPVPRRNERSNIYVDEGDIKNSCGGGGAGERTDHPEPHQVPSNHRDPPPLPNGPSAPPLYLYSSINGHDF